MADVPTIQEFYKVVQERDFNRQNQLRVLAIDAGPGFDVEFSPDDLVYIQTNRLPQRNIQATDASFMGLDFHVPGNVKYDGSGDYALTLWADQKLNLYDKFVQWSRQVFDDADSTGNYLAAKAGATMTLVAVDTELKVVRKVKLVGVFIKNVDQVEYDIKDAGSVQSFGVTISFHYWEEID
jgi:hypothetical protein